jgi:cyclopropane-fatty-acyl-phospholipid synthase
MKVKGRLEAFKADFEVGDGSIRPITPRLERGVGVPRRRHDNWWMDRLSRAALNRLVRKGTLRITTAFQNNFTVGDGTGRPIAVRFKTLMAQLAVLVDPELKLGEAYVDETIVMETGSIADLLALGMSQDRSRNLSRWMHPLRIVRYFTRRLQQLNGRNRARRNVSHHYDLNSRLYSLFLDANRQYSCAYFETPDQTLDDAQLAKKRHLAAKLQIAPGDTVLDIGAGWGGLALYLAETCNARVTGITLSQEQLTFARETVAENGLTERVALHLSDYREVTGRFNRIVSVGMFEHVGVGFYDRYLRKCADLLVDDGVFVLHSIGRSDCPGITNPWINKYIFPGGYIPALSEALAAIERVGWFVTDIEILRLHYAETLKAWRDRFLARRDDAEALYDECFVRMWEFYLAASEMAFREGGMMVFQIQMTKRQNVVPMTRDYILEEETRLRQIEDSNRVRFRLAGE